MNTRRVVVVAVKCKNKIFDITSDCFERLSWKAFKTHPVIAANSNKSFKSPFPSPLGLGEECCFIFPPVTFKYVRRRRRRREGKEIIIWMVKLWMCATHKNRHFCITVGILKLEKYSRVRCFLFVLVCVVREKVGIQHFYCLIVYERFLFFWGGGVLSFIFEQLVKCWNITFAM